MIVLDTHIWIWWASGNSRFSATHQEIIQQNQKSSGVGVSVISCWEIAKLAEYGKISFSVSVSEWLDLALDPPGVQLLEMTPQIAVESTQLPPPFHRDPADQIIVATARIHNCPLLTVDQKILAYQHVEAL